MSGPRAVPDDQRPTPRTPAREAVDHLMPVVESELRRVAQRLLRAERPDHTLRPTELINEAFLQLARQRKADEYSRDQLLGLGARMIRRILVDHARHRNRQRRGGGWGRVPLVDVQDVAGDSAGNSPGTALDVLALDEALAKLEAIDPEKSQMVELRFFGGLTNEETARVLGKTRRQIDGQWKATKLWLRRELTRGTGD